MGMTLVERISMVLGIPLSTVKEYAGLSNSKKDYYRVAYIPKRHKPGQYRKIFLPCPEIKLIQHFLVDTILSKLEVHKAAKAYVKGTNVMANAHVHWNNKHFLLLDIEHFFDSMDADILSHIFRNRLPDYSDADLQAIIAICSYRGSFVQGCVSSPAIANIYLYDFDVAMDALAKALPNGQYSRYSDDMVFSSSERIPENLAESVKNELSKYRLHINSSKTRFISNVDRLKITGIRLRRDRSLGLDTKFKKELKMDAYAFLKKASNGCATPKERQHLLGKLAYLAMADPHYFNVVDIKYKTKDLLLFDYVKSYKSQVHSQVPISIDVIPQDVISAASANQFFCYVDVDAPSDAFSERTMIALLLYNGIYDAVDKEIRDGEGNLFLPLAYFRFRTHLELLPKRVYVAMNENIDVSGSFQAEEIVPCPYLQMLNPNGFKRLSFRTPTAKEAELAQELLSQWRRLEEYE